MNFNSSTFTPMPAKQAPVEPPKEKCLLLVERIVKASDTDLKSSEIPKGDEALIQSYKKTLDDVKSTKKVTLDLLKTFVDQIGNLVKLPSNLVKTCVHGRLIERGDKGESKVLIDKKGGMTRPQGERNHGQGDDGYRGRGGPRRGGRGDYQGPRDGGRGYRGGGHMNRDGFN